MTGSLSATKTKGRQPFKFTEKIFEYPKNGLAYLECVKKVLSRASRRVLTDFYPMYNECAFVNLAKNSSNEAFFA